MDDKLLQEIDGYTAPGAGVEINIETTQKLVGLLQRARDRLGDLPHWVSVEDKLPEKYCHVQLYREREDFSLPGFYDGENFFALTADIGKSWHSGVTHWSPQLPPPSGKDG
jgi:hypothetical protein